MKQRNIFQEKFQIKELKTKYRNPQCAKIIEFFVIAIHFIWKAQRLKFEFFLTFRFWKNHLNSL